MATEESAQKKRDAEERAFKWLLTKWVTIVGLVVLVAVTIYYHWPTTASKTPTQTTITAPQITLTEQVETEEVLLTKGRAQSIAGKSEHCVRWPKAAPVLIQIQERQGLSTPIKSSAFTDGKYHSGVYTFSIDPDLWPGETLKLKVRHVPYNHPDAATCRWK